MERKLHALEDQTEERRLQRFGEQIVGLEVGVVYLDDLFPPAEQDRRLDDSVTIGRIVLSPDLALAA